MKTRRIVRALAWPALALFVLALAPERAAARPNYFDAFVGFYGFSPGDDLYACGVCHLKWGGTGARNPYGTAVEQQLYIGAKPIIDAIRDVEDTDTDLDGFTNVDELLTYGTLPGYACDNFTIALDTPPTFQSLITPLVPSCLEPMDVRVSPIEVSLFTKVGTTDEVEIEVINNGSDFPITVSGFGLLPGATAGLSVSGPPLPAVIPVGGSATLSLAFTPPASSLVAATLRISSDDPDEPALDVPISGISFVPNLAPAAERRACHESVERRSESLARTRLKAWSACFLDELRGVACDTGARDLAVARAEARLRATLGGATDRHCAAQDLTPTRLGLPDTCGGGCGGIALDTLSDWADCLVCRQEEATAALLDATVGTTPPDLPASVLSRDAFRCSRTVVQRMQRAILALQRKIAACELGNVTATTPTECTSALAADVARLTARLDATLERCRDTAGMGGCHFQPGADPACLSDAATSIGGALVESVFATE